MLLRHCTMLTSSQDITLLPLHVGSPFSFSPQW